MGCPQLPIESYFRLHKRTEKNAYSRFSRKRLVEWNEENRMVAAERPGSAEHQLGIRVEFLYDGTGRRRIKKVYSWSGSDWQLDSELRFVYDQNNLVAELDESDTVEKSYVWGIDLSGSEQGAGGVGGLLSVDGNSYPAYDGNGNITAYTDSSDEVVYSCWYSPFGKAIEEEGTKPCDFGFSTKPLDQETGLNYYIFRYYDSRLGRWMSRDPIEEEGGFNLYGFVSNNPINSIDYLGKDKGFWYDWALRVTVFVFTWWKDPGDPTGKDGTDDIEKKPKNPIEIIEPPKKKKKKFKMDFTISDELCAAAASAATAAAITALDAKLKTLMLKNPVTANILIVGNIIKIELLSQQITVNKGEECCIH